MSLSLTAKAGIGGLGTASVVAPTAYVVWDKYFSLNEIENAIFDKESATWNVEDSTGQGAQVIAKASAQITKEGVTPAVTYSWECTITGEGLQVSEKDKFKNYLKHKLTTEGDKQIHRQSLIKACSKERETVEGNEKDTKVKAKLTLKVTKSGDNSEKISTSLLGEGKTSDS